jgi:hypothetical protein
MRFYVLLLHFAKYYFSERCHVAQADFQEQWQVLVGMLGEGAGAADMFCRILVAIDEDVISLDIPRGQEGVRASMELKVTLF